MVCLVTSVLSDVIWLVFIIFWSFSNFLLVFIKLIIVMYIYSNFYLGTTKKSSLSIYLFSFWKIVSCKSPNNVIVAIMWKQILARSRSRLFAKQIPDDNRRGGNHSWISKLFNFFSTLKDMFQCKNQTLNFIDCLFFILLPLWIGKFPSIPNQIILLFNFCPIAVSNTICKWSQPALAYIW